MAARNYNNVMIDSTAWDNAVDSTALPLVDTGNNRVRYNDATSKWEFYNGGTLVATIDSSGNLRIKGVVISEEPSP